MGTYVTKQSGNALFLILIAVALFAALSYAVTQSGRSSGGIGKEEASIAAAEIMQMASKIEQAVTRMRIVSGCSDTTLSFHYDSDDDGDLDGDDDYYNSTTPSNNVCKIFHPEGGKIPYGGAPAKWLDGVNTAEFGYGELYITGSTCVNGVGDGGTSCHGDSIDNEELILFIPYLKQEICRKLASETNGLNAGAIPQESTTSWNESLFDGTYSDSVKLGGTNINGKLTGCFEGGGDPAAGTYHFFHVLRVR